MAVRSCISTIKLLGLGSLGLLTTSIIYQSIQNIPQLIDGINSIYQLNLSTLNHQILKTKQYILGSRIINGVLTGLSTLFFSLAFKYSAVDEKHPYLIYAAIGAPLSLFGLYYKAWIYEDKILSKSESGKDRKHTKFTSPVTSSVSTSDIEYEDGDEGEDAGGKEKKKDYSEPTETISKVCSAENELGRSYVHLSDESGISTPTSTQPPSPQIKQQNNQHEDEDEDDIVIGESSEQPRKAKTVEEIEVDAEVETILIKKEVVQDLKHIRSGYYIASYISGVSLTLAVVGLFGDFYFL
ncbi:hypothetical protein KGF56_002671 [Candida oxycetoniae]|uniref:Autophagy-related protein 33 n=1 Tax=Candida oxycetoniae TaxID=497107 RepID=A0AAI9SWP9_9ASCO|nr:uncharacterized protein KGF56_002671 [Candida oxycetoniae]KAI3404479.1 hypothetical protein KGF56_002671 [Candida oxycetoniae]